jgi:uncharacterized protein YggU (UPF0235/DUF167 family)
VLITVAVKPRSRPPDRIRLRPDGVYEAAVSAVPSDGKANEAVRALLATHFQRPKTFIRLVRGARGKLKIFDIPDD